jgi:hypothetical protein
MIMAMKGMPHKDKIMKQVDKIIVYYTDSTFEEVKGIQPPNIPKFVETYQNFYKPTSNNSLIF